MPRTSVYVLASLVSSVSAALILASSSSYTKAHSPQGTANHFKGRHSTCYGGGDGCWTNPYQIANLNSVEDFCLWAPSQPPLSVTKDVEHALVAWCLKGAHSTRLIPEGAILGARLLITPEYVQITGVGSLSRINVPSGGIASASEDRFHSLVFTSAYGQLEQIYNWTSFISQDRFCFRACKPSAVASTICPPVHDVFGCSDDAPGSYDVGTFEDCVGDAVKAPSTLFQGVLAASSHDTVHPFSSCTTRHVVGDARVNHARRIITCTSNCTNTSSPVPTTMDNATSITPPLLPTSTSSSIAYTNSSTPALPTPPVSTVYPSDTCTIYSYPYWYPHHHSSASSASPSPLSSNISFSNSGCWGAASSDPFSASSISSPTWSTPSFTPAVSAYSSSDPLSFGTLPSVTTSVPAPTFTSTTSTYDSSDTLPAVTSPTSSPTFTSMSYMTSSYNPSSPPPSSSFSSSSDFILSSTSSLTLPPFTLSSSTSPTLSPMPPSSPPESSLLSSSPSSASSQSSWVPILTSSSFASDPMTTSESSQSPTVSTPSSSPSPPPPSPSSVPSSVSMVSPVPSPTFSNSQTQLGSQCPPPSPAAGNGASRPEAPLLLSLMLVVLTIVSLSSVGVLVL